MSKRYNRIIAVLMVMILAFNFAACSGAKKLSEDPSDVVSRLEKAIQSGKADDVLALTMVEKGSTLYKEYKETINIDLYDDEMAGCYKAVAERVKIKFSESDVETGNGIAKVSVTFKMPDYQKVFGDNSIASAKDLVEAIGKAETIDVNLTLRLIDTKDGLKIKNVEDLMDVFDFVGYDIVSATVWGEPDETKPETKPTEKTPKETEPDKTTPAETDPSEPEPSESKQPTKAPQPASGDAMTKAYADYKKILEANKDGIAAYEKKVNADSCGLTDLTGDGIPDLYFFTINEKDNYINFCIYTYNPGVKAASAYMTTSLTEVDSKVSEFAVIRCPNGDVVCYKGFIDEKNAISYYTLYENYDMPTSSTLGYSGCIICGVTGGDTEKAVCSVSGFDKYTSSTKIKYDEFVKLEKDLMTKADVLFGSKFLSGVNSNVSVLLSGRKNDGQSYATVLKQLE